LRREEREGEEAHIPRDFELREREQQQDWVGTHPKEGIGKHPRGVSTFSSSVHTIAEGGIHTTLMSEGFASNTSDSTPKDTPLEDTQLEIPVNEEVAQQAKKLLDILTSDNE
jgi:hypothetical protein